MAVYRELNAMLCKMTAAQGTPNRGKGGKSINLIKFDIVFDFSPKWSWGLLDRLKILSWSPLRFSTIGKPILRTFQILTFLTNFRPWPKFEQMPTIYLNKDLIFWMSDDFDKLKKMRNVRTIIFYPFSRRDLCHVSENKGFRFLRKNKNVHLKTWEWRSGRLPSANTSQKMRLFSKTRVWRSDRLPSANTSQKIDLFF